MKKEKDYSRDLADIRQMMERSSKFLSLSGLSGVFAGIYALCAAYIASTLFKFNPSQLYYSVAEIEQQHIDLQRTFILAVIVLSLAVITAALFSYKNAIKHSGSVWNATTRRLIINLTIPLVAGGILLLLLLHHSLLGWLAPFSMIFYGLGILNASKYTYNDIRGLGIIQILLGLIASVHVEFGLIICSIGFGLMHIVYGIYLHLKYERESNN